MQDRINPNAVETVEVRLAIPPKRLDQILRAAGVVRTVGLLAVTLALTFHSPATPLSPGRSAEARVLPGEVESHKVRVTDSGLATRIAYAGGRLIADYGSYQLYAMARIASDLTTNGAVEIRDDYNWVMLNAVALDTRRAEVQALRTAVGDFQGRRLHLVQFAGPVQRAWREALTAAGVRLVAYIPQNAYLVYGDAASIAQVQRWAASAPEVQWDGAYLADYAIHPAALPVDESGLPREVGTDRFAVQLVADDEANASTLELLDRVQLEPRQRRGTLLNCLNLVVRLAPETLARVAAQPDVISLQPYFTPRRTCERQDQILAGNLTGNAPSGPGYLAWLASKGFAQEQFTASGLVVDVSDSGIDNGTTAPGHFALYTGGDTTRASRVAYTRLEGTPNGKFLNAECGTTHRSVSTLQGWDGHGTLNAHIVAGYDDRQGSPHTDKAGYQYGLGVCPFVRVGSSVIFDPDYFTSPDYATLLSDAYHNGARISNQSWGSTNGASYDADAQAFDALVRDAGGGSADRPMVLVIVAGNEGPAARSVDSPGTAKNAITVGALENVRSLTPSNGGNNTSGNDGGDTPDAEADSANDMTSFSSRGPCRDGRMKPDLVAPGTHITAGVPQDTPAPAASGTGSALACYDASGVNALAGSGGAGNSDNFFPLGQEFFTVSSGTSHAGPAVSGACALLRQYFINQGLAPPSPAMTKAYLMNGARYLTGSYAKDTLWSASQGMGALNLGVAFDGLPRLLRDQAVADLFTATGQTRTFTGAIADPSKAFRVTLVWTDAPGSTTGAAYNNDLDLTVSVGGGTYKGNVFSGANSITGGTSDARNNVESVFLPHGSSGPVVVKVTAANLASVSAPTADLAPAQDFALVIYNFTMSMAVAPTITEIQVSGSGVSISFLSTSGLTYTLEYKDSWAADWAPLPTAVTGTGEVLALADDTGAPASRFYRVRAE